jgi:hypothetical protein
MNIADYLGNCTITLKFSSRSGVDTGLESNPLKNLASKKRKKHWEAAD